MSACGTKHAGDDRREADIGQGQDDERVGSVELQPAQDPASRRTSGEKAHDEQDEGGVEAW
jgi:hypothetical protein